VPIDMDRVSSYSFSAWAYSFAAGLTVDRSVLAIVSRGGSAGVDVRTGRLSWAHEYDPRAFGRMYAMAMGADEYVVLLNTGEILVHDKRTGRQLWRHRLGQSQLPWRAPPQLAGSMLLTCHGRTNLLATLFDMNTRKVAATGDVGPVGKGQAHLTADGLLVVFDGGSLRLSEPISGIGQPIWSVRLEPGTSPKILATTDTHVVVAPNSNQGLIQLRSLADDGSVVRTFQTSSVKGRAAYPLRGRIVGNRLYVVTGSRADYSFVAPTVRVLSYCRDPSLQVFDLSSGRPAWQAVDLSPAGGGTYVYAMPLEIGQRHICALSKAQPYTRPGTLRIIDFRTGRVVQEPVSVPGVPPGRKTSRYRYMLGSGPVLTSGRLVLDTPKGVVVYGKSN
jgi:outer membrane protein assembly factor BamB